AHQGRPPQLLQLLRRHARLRPAGRRAVCARDRRRRAAGGARRPVALARGAHRGAGGPAEHDGDGRCPVSAAATLSRAAALIAAAALAAAPSPEPSQAPVPAAPTPPPSSAAAAPIPTTPPALGDVKPLTVPPVTERRLSNGLRVLLVEHRELPVV